MSNKYDELLKFIPILKEGSSEDWVINHENDGTPEQPKHLGSFTIQAVLVN